MIYEKLISIENYTDTSIEQKKLDCMKQRLKAIKTMV